MVTLGIVLKTIHKLVSIDDPVGGHQRSQRLIGLATNRNRRDNWPGGCKSIGWWNHYELGPHPWLISQEWEGWLIWNDSDVSLDMMMLDPQYELWPHPWPWAWIFHIKFRNSHISGMGGLIDMEKRDVDWMLYTLKYDLDLEFSRLNFEIAVFWEW